MIQNKSIIFCLSYFVIGSYSAAVSFIDKCEWNNKQCLIASSKKALPYIAAGVPELGLPPMDPLRIDKVVYEEGGFNIVFTDINVNGTSKCDVVNVERNKDESWLKFEAECPIEVHGHYVASGKLLFVPVTGDGPFHVRTDKIFISVTVALKTIDGEDGDKYWKISKPEQIFEFKEKAYIKFENLFDGNQEKAAPVESLLDNQWKDLVQAVGGPIVNTFMNQIVDTVNEITKAIPAKDLEIL